MSHWGICPVLHRWRSNTSGHQCSERTAASHLMPWPSFVHQPRSTICFCDGSSAQTVEEVLEAEQSARFKTGADAVSCPSCKQTVSRTCIFYKWKPNSFPSLSLSVYGSSKVWNSNCTYRSGQQGSLCHRGKTAAWGEKLGFKHPARRRTPTAGSPASCITLSAGTQDLHADLCFLPPPSRSSKFSGSVPVFILGL